MFKKLQWSPFTKSLRSRLGNIISRSSTTSLTGGSARPPTPSRSSGEHCRLYANALGPENVMPNPATGSPIREAAESMPEPAEPPKRSLEVSSNVTFTPESALAVDLALTSDAAPVSLHESSLTALPKKSSHEPVSAKSDAMTYISCSPESLSRAKAAPWDGGPPMTERSFRYEQEALAAPKAVSPRPDAVFIDRFSTPPLATEAPPVRADNVSNASITIHW